MKFVKRLVDAVKTTRRGILKTWGGLCESYFDVVSSTYPELIEMNVRELGSPTVELLEYGETSDEAIEKPQYPRLALDPLDDPATRALLEVGAIRLHPSGDTVVEPSPGALIRGLARLALPTRFLIGIVNSARQRRGDPPLSDAEFGSMDRELFESLRRGLRRSIGEGWFGALNQASYHLHRRMALPCTPLPNSQEFYEEGINFYRGQGADAEVFVYSTTSGLVIPREFRGDASKNHYRYQYFTRGVLGTSACTRVYQWERYRTARELALGYERAGTQNRQRQYLEESFDTLARFADAKNISIHEAKHFSSWKSRCTLVGPERQFLSIRDKDQQLKIGHGIAYDVGPFEKRSDLLRDAANLINGAGALGTVIGEAELVMEYGPAVAVAAAACAVGGVATKRLSSCLRIPLLRMCKEDCESSDTQVIKDVDEALTRDEVVSVVDGLLSDGSRILESERALDTA
jgi:hypothetical protein